MTYPEHSMCLLLAQPVPFAKMVQSANRSQEVQGWIWHARTIETFGHDIHWHWHSQIRTLAGLAHFAAGFAEVVVGGTMVQTIHLETRCLSSACLWPFRKREVGMFVSATGTRFSLFAGISYRNGGGGLQMQCAWKHPQIDESMINEWPDRNWCAN